MNGCIYRTEENKCKQFSVGGVLSFCYLDGTCDCQIPSNADRIRAMSDEELAIWLSAIMDCSKCVCEIPCAKEITTKFCKDVLRDWLKAPVEVGDA